MKGWAGVAAFGQASNGPNSTNFRLHEFVKKRVFLAARSSSWSTAPSAAPIHHAQRGPMERVIERCICDGCAYAYKRGHGSAEECAERCRQDGRCKISVHNQLSGSQTDHPQACSLFNTGAVSIIESQANQPVTCYVKSIACLQNPHCEIITGETTSPSMLPSLTPTPAPTAQPTLLHTSVPTLIPSAGVPMSMSIVMHRLCGNLLLHLADVKSGAICSLSHRMCYSVNCAADNTAAD